MKTSMKYLLVVAVLFSNLYFAQNAKAQALARAFHDPHLPSRSSSYRISQWHKKKNLTINKYHIGEDRNRGACDDDYGDNVYTIANGRVTYAQYVDRTWGNVVIIRHILPDRSVVNSLYGHLSFIDTRVGWNVRLGGIIGRVGNAIGIGNRLSCAHLHLEIRTNRSLERVPGRGYASSLNDPIWRSHVKPSDFIRDH